MGDLTFEPVADEVASSLEDACQRNGWLRVGGYAWQDDPYLEEYPYAFVATKNIDDLRGFFEHGNWAIRQGIVYDNLAFIQQVDGGDEWWTLKRSGDSWIDFESISCGGMIERSKEDFERLVASMQAATIDECRRLDYLFPSSMAQDLVGLSREYAASLSENDQSGGFREFAIRRLSESPLSIEETYDLDEETCSYPPVSSMLREVYSRQASQSLRSLGERVEDAKEASEKLSRRDFLRSMHDPER